MASEFFSKVGRKIKQHRFGLVLATAVVVSFVVYPLGIMVATGMGVYILWLILSALVGFVGGEFIKFLSTRFFNCFSEKWGKTIVEHFSDCVAVGALFLVASFFFPPLAIPGILFLTGPMVVNGIAFIAGVLIAGIVKIFRCCCCPHHPSLPDNFGISNSVSPQEPRQNDRSDQNESALVDAEKKDNISDENALENDEDIDEFTDQLIEKERLLSQQQRNLNKRPGIIDIPSDVPSLSHKNTSSRGVYTPSTPHTVFTMKTVSEKKTWKDWGIFKCCKCCRSDDSYEPSYMDSNISNLMNSSLDQYNDAGMTYVNYDNVPGSPKKDLSIIPESHPNSDDEHQETNSIH